MESYIYGKTFFLKQRNSKHKNQKNGSFGGKPGEI